MSQPRSASSPPAAVIRPSFRLVRPFYTLAFILLAACYAINNNRPDPMEWLFIFPALVFIWAIARHIGQRFTSVTIGGGKLRFQTGLLSRNTRTMELAKIQDVRVQQSLVQRLLNIGDLEIETAGERGGLSMKNVDRPQSVADFLLETSGK